MRIGNDDLTNGTPISMVSSFNTEPVFLGHIVNYSIQLVFTGTPAGNFKLQCSNDFGDPSNAVEADRDIKIVNWTDVLDSAQSISAAGNHTYDVQNAGYRWVRVVWTQTGSTGSLTSARFNVKGV